MPSPLPRILLLSSSSPLHRDIYKIMTLVMGIVHVSLLNCTSLGYFEVCRRCTCITAGLHTFTETWLHKHKRMLPLLSTRFMFMIYVHFEEGGGPYAPLPDLDPNCMYCLCPSYPAPPPSHKADFMMPRPLFGPSQCPIRASFSHLLTTWARGLVLLIVVSVFSG